MVYFSYWMAYFSDFSSSPTCIKTLVSGRFETACRRIKHSQSQNRGWRNYLNHWGLRLMDQETTLTQCYDLFGFEVIQ